MFCPCEIWCLHYALCSYVNHRVNIPSEAQKGTDAVQCGYLALQLCSMFPLAITMSDNKPE